MLQMLVEYREAHNLTQAELANILGVTRESLYRWITGKVKLRASNKRAIKRLLKTPTSTDLDEFDLLTSELLNEWKCLGRSNRLKILQYIEEIKTPEKKATNRTIQKVNILNMNIKRLLSYYLNSRLFLVNVFSIKTIPQNRIIPIYAFFTRSPPCRVKDVEEENSK